jgi:hypothetical protein
VTRPTAEPRGLYDWTIAPEWAQFAAMDENGQRWWYGKRPRCMPMDGVWFENDTCEMYPGPRANGSCWKHSLEPRPTPTPSEPGGEVGEGDLPPLPEPAAWVVGHRLERFVESRELGCNDDATAWAKDRGEGHKPLYTAEQTRAYALAFLKHRGRA